LNGIAGDGAVYSTTGDLFIWDRALYTEVLVSKATLEEAFTPVVMNNGSTYNYGFGWSIDSTLSDKKGVNHGGGWVGFRTWISREIEEDNTIILLTNHSSQYVSSIKYAIECILHSKPVKYPKISIAQIIGKTLILQGVDSAISQYRLLEKNEHEKYNFSENELNSLGYYLIQQMNNIPDAITIFKLNVECYPEAANPYDSLGEAYMLNGNTKLAIKNYEKSLELNPNNSNAVEKLKELKQLK
jgi:tetratricopeptide (TPR) repeat protein